MPDMYSRIFRQIMSASILAAACIAPVACGGAPVDPSALTPSSAIAAAIAHSARPADDLADDASRKPADVLAFAGVEPGMRIFEMEAGRGYYTEILSRAVGPAGAVIIQNPPAFESFAGAAIDRRLRDDRLANVQLTRSNFDDLKADDGAVDIVTWFLGPHELYFMPAGVEDLGDETRAYGEIMRVLKPGGYFVVLDHAAPPGAPKSTGGDTHRIDPAIVKTLAGAAGFELVDQSDILRNPNDQYALGVFDLDVRRKTDRFLLKFRKPE